jgi:hypothetical protein
MYQVPLYNFCEPLPDRVRDTLTGGGTDDVVEPKYL